MFAYSMREKTHAHRRLTDDVPEAVKQRRLQEVASPNRTEPDLTLNVTMMLPRAALAPA